MENRKRSGNIVFPILGMLTLFPGVVMHGFALGEAYRLGSDWVYLSTPLLVIGAASFAWLLHSLMGTAGLGIGAAVSLVAFVGAGINLQNTVTERARHMESSRQLSDAERFCDGDGKPNPLARPYVEGGTNPIVFHGGGMASYDPSFAPFKPKPYGIEHAALISCLSDKIVPLETCTGYTGGGVVDRQRVDVSLRVFSIKTGTVVFEKSFEGKQPRACGSTEQFYGKSLHTSITGERPAFDVIAELGPLLKP